MKDKTAGQTAYEANKEAWPGNYVPWENLTQSARDGWAIIAEKLWERFCEDYPIRLSADIPEVQKFFEENEKAVTDMMVYGCGAVKYMPVEDIITNGDV